MRQTAARMPRKPACATPQAPHTATTNHHRRASSPRRGRLGLGWSTWRVAFSCAMACAIPLVASASFGGRSLISAPTAEVLPRGAFVASLTGGYRAEDPYDRTSAALAMDFGAGNRLQGGAEWRGAGITDGGALLWDARALVIREQGSLPNVSVGVGGVGEGKAAPVGMALVSKEFNLPSAGFFKLHAGIVAPLFPDVSDEDVKPIGGIEKTWYALSRDWRTIAEWDGDAFAVGVEQRFREGLRVGVAFETDTPRMLFTVGFGNEPLVTEIDSAKRLAKQAARLATRAQGDQ